jgi:hypothetical protein
MQAGHTFELESLEHSQTLKEAAREEGHGDPLLSFLVSKIEDAVKRHAQKEPVPSTDAPKYQLGEPAGPAKHPRTPPSPEELAWMAVQMELLSIEIGELVSDLTNAEEALPGFASWQEESRTIWEVSHNHKISSKGKANFYCATANNERTRNPNDIGDHSPSVFEVPSSASTWMMCAASL